MVPYTNLTKDDLQHLLEVFRHPTDFTADQLQNIVQALALCHLKSLIDFPLFGAELDRALDMDFGFNNRSTVARIKPTELLGQLGLLATPEQ